METAVVTDDDALASLAGRALESAGHTVDVVRLADAATLVSDVEVIVIHDDSAMVGEVCRAVRRRSPSVAIIAVGEGRDEAHRVLLLDAGADAYLRAPIGARELMAYVRALTRPRTAARSGDLTRVGEHVRIDRRARRVTVRGVEMHLTVKEFDVLAYLCEDPGAVKRRPEIVEAVWGGQWFGPTKTLDAHVAALRQKLAGAVRITAVRGVGFRVDLA